MRRLLALVAMLAAVSCGGDSSTAPENIAGTYTLRSVNGSPLPYTIAAAGTYKFEVTDDQLTLTDGGTYTQSGHNRTTNNGVVTTDSGTDAGTYVRTGTAITFRSTSDGTVVNGTIAGGNLTIVDGGLSAVYSK